MTRLRSTALFAIPLLATTVLAAESLNAPGGPPAAGRESGGRRLERDDSDSGACRGRRALDLRRYTSGEPVAQRPTRSAGVDPIRNNSIGWRGHPAVVVSGKVLLDQGYEIRQ